MSDTTVGHPPGLAEGVGAYVRAVRAELADLPTEDLDDLTGGMEADLSELAAESGGDLVGRLGPPMQYAAELRSAAGLPERMTGPVRRRPLTDALTHFRASLTMFTSQRPWLRSATAYLATLRPAWWLIRGYLAAWALWSLLGGMRGLRPHGVLELAMALVAIVVSIQLSRGWLRQWPGLRGLLMVANAVAVVVALLALTSGVTSGETDFSTVDLRPPPGVALDGAQVSNIYAYGPDGRRLTGVRLFAQDGRPLKASQSSVDANGRSVSTDVNGNPLAVVRDTSGAPQLNVYPQMLFGLDPWQVTDPASVQASSPQWSPPMSINPVIPGSTSTGTPTPAARAATPTATATPNATAIPKPTATPKPKAPTSRPEPTTSALTTPPSGPTPSVTLR